MPKTAPETLPNTLDLSVADTTATISLRGAEPLSWRVGGRELLWHGAPDHWSYRAPILFPVVGASARGLVRVGGRTYPMPQHGFARTAVFDPVERGPATATLRLTESPDTLAQYPFRFALEVTVALSRDAMRLDFAVTNTGEDTMPYGLGFHPAFPWPLPGSADRSGHRVVFSRPERPEVPEIAEGGLLARRTRTVPLAGRALPLAPELFTEALVFLDADSRRMAFEAPDGAAVTMEVEEFPHLAIWSRANAPFLSLEAWSAHADWEDAAGTLAERPSMMLLPPGSTGRHAVTLSWRQAADPAGWRGPSLAPTRTP